MLMDNLMENAPCGFLSFTDTGEIIEVNATLQKLLGYEQGELTTLMFEKILTVAGRIFYQTHFFPLLKLHEKVEEIYLDLSSKTNETIPVLVNAARQKRGETIFNDCIFVAIRQRNRFEEEILHAKRQAEAATRAKDEFLSVVSHELRTPLNAILGWGQMLESKNLDAQTANRAVEAIVRNARSQTQLIEDILDYARITSGKLKLEIGSIDLVEVTEAALEVVAPSANAKQIRIQTVLDSNAYISGDAARIQQILWNLLQNAVKFTPKGGSITIRIQRVNSSVEITVSDTGKGISTEFLPYVFDRFQQADTGKSRRYSGLGLGLSIVRHIVELHGGTIRAESEGENLGASFTVRLPFTNLREQEIHAAESAEKFIAEQTITPTDDAPRLEDIHILIVDDEADARDLLTAILSFQGALVTSAASAAEAVEKFQTKNFDLIVSDIEMPGEDGFSLIKKLNELDGSKMRKTPVVALTAHAFASERIKILKAGFQIHLSKPVEPAELLAVAANFAALRK